MRDSDGLLKHELYYERDRNVAAWKGLAKQDYSYDEAGNLNLENISHWDPVSADWLEHIKQEYFYDPSNRLVLDRSFNWDPVQVDWLKYLKHEYEYDSRGRPSLVTGLTLDADLNDWVPAGQFEISHLSDGNSSSSIYSIWDRLANDWQVFFKSDENYNSLGDKTSRIVSYWDSNTSEWLVSHKLEYSYDFRGNKVLETHYDMDLKKEEWIRSYKYQMYSDLHGNRLLEIHSTWDQDPGKWTILYTTHYHYDSRTYMESASICSGDSLLWRGDYYSSEGTHYTTAVGGDSIYKLNLTVNPSPAPFIISGQTVVSENQISIYNTPENTEVVYSWYSENGDVLSHPTENSTEIQWDAAGEGVLISVAENEYGCKSSPSTLTIAIGSIHVEELVEDEFKIYPNPASDHFYIECPSLERENVRVLRITDQLGRVVFETELTATKHMINTRSWSREGLYFVQLIDPVDSGINTKKLIID